MIEKRTDDDRRAHELLELRQPERAVASDLQEVVQEPHDAEPDRGEQQRDARRA